MQDMMKPQANARNAYQLNKVVQKFDKDRLRSLLTVEDLQVPLQMEQREHR